MPTRASPRLVGVVGRVLDQRELVLRLGFVEAPGGEQELAVRVVRVERVRREADVVAEGRLGSRHVACGHLGVAERVVERGERGVRGDAAARGGDGGGRVSIALLGVGEPSHPLASRGKLVVRAVSSVPLAVRVARAAGGVGVDELPLGVRGVARGGEAQVLVAVRGRRCGAVEVRLCERRVGGEAASTVVARRGVVEVARRERQSEELGTGGVRGRRDRHLLRVRERSRSEEGGEEEAVHGGWGGE